MRIAYCGSMILLSALVAVAPASMAAGRRSFPSPQANQADQSAPANSTETQAAAAQNGEDQADPLAAAARRARQKQKEQPEPARVWDNDNIPSSGQVSVVGKPALSAPATVSSSAAANAAQQDQKTGAQPAEKRSALEAQLKSAKDDLKNLQTTLDFAQRKLALDQASYYQKPNYASDSAGAQKLKDEQSAIDAKQQQVDADQKKVDDLQAAVQSAGEGKDSGAAAGSGASGNSSGAANSGKSSAQ